MDPVSLSSGLVSIVGFSRTILNALSCYGPPDLDIFDEFVLYDDILQHLGEEISRTLFSRHAGQSSVHIVASGFKLCHQRLQRLEKLSQKTKKASQNHLHNVLSRDSKGNEKLHSFGEDSERTFN